MGHEREGESLSRKKNNGAVGHVMWIVITTKRIFFCNSSFHIYSNKRITHLSSGLQLPIRSLSAVSFSLHKASTLLTVNKPGSNEVFLPLRKCGLLAHNNFPSHNNSRHRDTWYLLPVQTPP